MIVKKRYPPMVLLILDACISRLRENHPQLRVLRQSAAQYQKGYNGERKLDYHLKHLDRSFSILNDVTLSVHGLQFQIDSLVVTGYGFYIIEVKNLSGEISFHTGLKQLTQQNGEVLVGRKYPITQVEKIAYNFSRWLKLQELEGLSMNYLVALADESAIVHVNGNEDPVTEVVSYVEDIPLRLINIDENLARTKEENHQLKNKVIHSVMKNLEELRVDILRKLELDLNHILPGVHCPSCEKLGMVRKRYKWSCPSCHSISKNAHISALLDFALIYSKEMTNSDCRKFLKIGESTAYSILKNTKGVKWNLTKRKWILDIHILRTIKLNEKA